MSGACAVCGGSTGENDAYCSGCGAGLKPEPEVIDVEAVTKAELVEQAREEGLPVSGTKDEIAERLEEAHAGSDEQTVTAGDVGSVSDVLA